MRHRVRGRKLGRNASHRKALFRNMACSLIRSVRPDEDAQKVKVPGRMITTVAKAKELRPYVEKLVTLARHARAHLERAGEFDTSAERGSSEWQTWRKSEEWGRWNQAVAPAVAMRRRAFAALRDNEAVDILFDELAERFEDRPGGYTRVVRLAQFRLGDAAQKAIIEFVGERDRVRAKRKAPVVAPDDELADDQSSRRKGSGADSGKASGAEASSDEPEA